MKAKELRELALDELEQKHRDLRKEHFELRKTKVTGKVENPLKFRLLRRDIARVQTILKERSKQGS
ncbi:MAG: 50S ribosomal protein L29 [Eubacteriales bacterium]|jgi:large subunit ribosomal protein L29|nr:50S ribosomal protein L29 [Eubacteriales bacterium]